MNGLIFFIIFMLVWATFCNICLYIYDKICYLYIDYIIENEKDEKKQRKLTKLLIREPNINVY